MKDPGVGGIRCILKSKAAGIVFLAAMLLCLGGSFGAVTASTEHGEPAVEAVAEHVEVAADESHAAEAHDAVVEAEAVESHEAVEAEAVAVESHHEAAEEAEAHAEAAHEAESHEGGAVHAEDAHAEDAHGAADAHGDEHGEGHGTKGWVATDTYRVLNFTVLITVLFLLLRKPVANALNGRIEGIREQLSELESKKAEAEKELAGYDKKLSMLDMEAQKIVAEYERQGEEAKKRILKEAESLADKLKDQARRNIEYEFEQARAAIQADILDKAMAKAEGILSAKITTEDQDRLVDEYLDKVVA